MKAKKTTKKPKKPRLARIWLWVTGVVVVTIGVLVWQQSYNQEQARLKEQQVINQDRQKFESAKKTVETIADRLRKVDTSVKWEVSASCSRASVFYGKGQAHCGVSVNSKLQVDTKDSVNLYVKKYNDKLIESDDVLNSRGDITGPDLSKGMMIDSKDISGYGTGNFTDIASTMHCSLSYEIVRRSSQDQRPALYISFGCSDDSLDTYF